MLYSDLYKQLLYGVIHEYEFPQEAIEIIIDRFLMELLRKDLIITWQTA